MKHPKITVVIPAFNEQDYLPLCLDSLQDQTYPKDKYDILVVDNNSSDRTAEIAKKAGARVITEKQQGHVFALNAGMQKAESEIIAVTDADTTVDPSWLAVIARLFEDQQVVAVTGSAYYTSHSKMKDYVGKMSYHVFLRLHYALGKTSLSGINLAVRKDAFYKIKGLDTRYKIFSDVELGLRIKNVGKVIYCKDLAVETSPRRWQKGTLEDYYKYASSYLKTVWLKAPAKGQLTPRR